MSRLNLARVLEVAGQLATEQPPPEERQAEPPPGGWGPTGPDERSHYMQITGQQPDQPGQVAVRSLCGQMEAEGDPGELLLCDPLARENCTTCRTKLLQIQGLI